MSVSAETYIVIALMFAVFAAVAAVGTSVVLGAGFERLRAGFELVKRQSGFFADAIYKLDQRTQKLDEETSKLKSGVYSMGERVTRVEKQTAFTADAVQSIEQRILQGSAAGTVPQTVRTDGLLPLSGGIQTPVQRAAPVPEVRVQPEPLMTGLFRDYPEEAPRAQDIPADTGVQKVEEPRSSEGLTHLLSRYFMGESSGSGKGVIYH